MSTPRDDSKLSIFEILQVARGVLYERLWVPEPRIASGAQKAKHVKESRVCEDFTVYD